MSHTPGPWEVDAREDASLRVLAMDDRRTIVADTMAASFNDTAMADARLIASAPDLLEALDQLLDDMGEHGLSVCQEAKDQAKAAIAKAKGDA